MVSGFESLSGSQRIKATPNFLFNSAKLNSQIQKKKFEKAMGIGKRDKTLSAVKITTFGNKRKNLPICLKFLKKNISLLVGNFVSKNSGYDNDICNILPNFNENTKRYWDANWEEENMFIEFKKGRSIWLDLVRYSEVLLKINDESKIETFTLFFIPNKERTEISEIIGLNTSRLIKKLNLNETDVEKLLNLNKSLPRSLNAQASLTVKDIKEISEFIVVR